MAEHAHSTPAPTALLRTVPLSLWPQAIRDRRRRLAAGLRRLEDLRAELVEKLDQLTTDADFEPDLGAPEHPNHLSASALRWIRYQAEHAPKQPNGEDREEEADLEPSLGAPDWTTNGGGRDQRRWALGAPSDLENDASDDEPSLGSLTTPCTMTVRREPDSRRAVGFTVHRDDQTAWGRSGHTDTEEQCEDEGAPEWA